MDRTTYDEAVAELEALLKKIEDPGRQLSDIAADVRRARELIEWCRLSLRGSNEELEKLLSGDEQED